MYFNDIRPMQGSRASQARGIMIEMRDINIRVDSRIMSIWKIEIDYRHEKVKKIHSGKQPHLSSNSWENAV